MSAQNISKNMEKIIICIGYIDRRLKLISPAIFDANQQIIVPGQNNEMDLVSDDIYYYVLDGKVYQDFSRQPWYLKLLK